MTRQYEVRHRTEYSYQDDVTSSYGWAYLTPRDGADQLCSSTRLEVLPGAALISDSVDYFGNRASYFEVHEPHRQLVVTATSLVEVSRVAPDLEALDRWSVGQAVELLAAGARSVPELDLCLPSPRLPTDPLVREFCADLLPAGRPLGAALRSLVRTIYQDFAYRPGATSVSSALTDVLERRAGVCQDFAHLAVAGLRAAGLPARYVSGYLETQPPPGQPKRLGSDASHAWVSVLVPQPDQPDQPDQRGRPGRPDEPAGGVWVDLDPTNDQVVDAGYVVTAWGRDYTDVPPLKGVIFTEGSSSRMSVGVDVLRLSGD
jgi:transglutaminase-like putative cysteine protease